MEEWSSRDRIAAELNEKKALLENSIDKRFIYFLATRPKVRFDTKKRVKYRWRSPVIQVPVKIWPAKKRKWIDLTAAIYDDVGRFYRPEVELTESTICIKNGLEKSVTISIHDFLQMADTEIGSGTHIRYVGSTKDPAKRLLKREHRGLTDTMYNIGTENFDYLVFTNICHVQSITNDPAYGLNIYTTNSLTDELDIEYEKKVIEGALIEYFQCDSQKLNKKAERSEFKNRILSMLGENRINRIAFHIAIEGGSEYFNFLSDDVTAKDEHSFSFEISNGKIMLTTYKGMKEVFESVGIKFEV